MRFIYSSHDTKEQAERAREDHYANGEIDTTDKATVEPRKSNQTGETHWFVFIEG